MSLSPAPVPSEALATLRRKLAQLPVRPPERAELLRSTSSLYGISRATLYRLLRGDRRPRDAHRADRGRPRVMSATEVERWCEIVAAMQARTTNRKGRHLSTARILEILVEHGVETPDGLRRLELGRMMVAGVTYEVDPDLVGETVVVWWGLFDQELFVEHGEARYGPYDPLQGPVPLHRYRKHRKSRREERSERVDALAVALQLPRSALSGAPDLRWTTAPGEGPRITTWPFEGPDPFHERAFPSALAARKAIANELRLPLGKLDEADRSFIAELLGRTLARPEVMAAVRDRFATGRAVTRTG